MSQKLTKAIVGNANPREKEYFLWDSEVRNFGLRIQPTGRKTFVYQYRVNRRSRRLMIGPADAVPVLLARDLAREAVVKVARGIDPAAEREAARNAMTVTELADRFDATHVTFHVKANTAREYRHSIRRYILPAFGTKKVRDVTRADVANLHIKMRDKPTQANRTIEVVSKMFNLAEEWELRAPNTNPRRGIRKYPETKRERFLSEAELLRIGDVLREMEAERIEMPAAIAAARLLMFTGCRLNEIMTLQWRFVDVKAGVLRLPDSKTGKKVVQLGAPALDVLRSIERVDGNPWGLTGRINGGALTDDSVRFPPIADMRSKSAFDPKQTLASRSLRKHGSLRLSSPAAGAFQRVAEQGRLSPSLNLLLPGVIDLTSIRFCTARQHQFGLRCPVAKLAVHLRSLLDGQHAIGDIALDAGGLQDR